MSETRNILLDIANELRENGPVDALNILQTAKARGITFDVQDVSWLLAREQHFFSICPAFIPKFINSYLKNRTTDSILDVWSGIGALLFPILQVITPNKAIALESKESAYKIACLLGYDKGIEWQLGSPLHLLDEIKERFDVVLGSPPWNRNPNVFMISFEKTNIEIRDDEDKLLILKASLLLAPDGVGFFITSPSFTMKRGKHTVYENLSRFGLFIDTILSLPSGTFSGTSLSGLLIIIRKQKPEKIFVGELSSNEASNNVLLKNLKARIEGKVRQHGILVKKEEFTSFQALVSEYEFKELGRQLGLQTTPINDVTLEKNLSKPSYPKGFLDHPNALYLPLIGRSHAITSLADLQLKPNNYIQIVLDPEKVNTEYLANFFNSTLGQKIRESLQSGVFIPRINKSLLNKAVVYIPKLSTQIEVRQVDATIEGLYSALETLKKQLWEQPGDAQNIQKLVNSLNLNESFENWIDSLPFPLASILWVYHADDNPKNKLAHLLNFFEAMVQFNTILMLSAYASEPDFYIKHSNKWFNQNSKNWFNHVSFGSWNYLGRKLANETRNFLDDINTRDHCLNMFGNPTHDFINLIINEKLFVILETVKDYRNQWKGHGGIESQSEAKKRLDLLELELAETRKLVMNNYSTACLLRPDNAEYRDAIHFYRIDALIGRSTPFKKLSKETISDMDSQKLYVLQKNQLKPVELLPFIQVAKNNACYFFTRIENDHAHYISYHFDQEPSLDIPLNGLESTFKRLFPDIKFASEKEDKVV